jgi:hypothetical protein
MPTLTDIRPQLDALFAGQRFGVLATHQEGQPFGSLVTFVAAADLTHLLFATSGDSRKYRNLCADPRVALVIDNRENTPADLAHAIAVTACGIAVPATPEALPALRARLLARHPALGDFLAAPDTQVIDVTVTQYDVVSDFSQVITVRLA